MKEKKLMEKIQNLLDLANNNPNENEAIAAALKAQELMAKYNIDMKEFHEAENEITQVTYQGAKKFSQTMKPVFAEIIARNFCCKTYVSKARGQISKIVFYGYEKDVNVALQVFTYVFETANKLGDKYYREAKKQGIATTDTWNNYMAGFADGVQEALARQCTALMIVTPKEVEDKFNEMTSSWKQKSVKLRYSDADALKTGKRDGKDTMKAGELECV